MKGYYVYIIKCADNSYYTGVTRDLLQRLQQHQSGIIPKVIRIIVDPLD
ncbi:GIY-YIG nuclease family protein [Elizabethkingia ursingii]